MEWTENHLTIEIEDDGTGFSKIFKFIETLQRKHNTLKMRSQIIGAELIYKKGRKEVSWPGWTMRSDHLHKTLLLF